MKTLFKLFLVLAVATLHVDGFTAAATKKGNVIVMVATNTQATTQPNRTGPPARIKRIEILGGKGPLEYSVRAGTISGTPLVKAWTTGFEDGTTKTLTLENLDVEIPQEGLYLHSADTTGTVTLYTDEIRGR
jgi:hypothetical protein